MNNQQIQFIVDNYQTKTDNEIAKELGYHPSSIKHTRLDLRLIKKTKGIKNAICHPDKRNVGFGLCKNCYEKHLRETNLDYAERQRENHRDWGKLNKDRIRANGLKYVSQTIDRIRKRNWVLNLEKDFGMSEEDYNVLYSKQDGRCAICNKEVRYRLVVDHNHTTGKVRGLLCRQYNLLLGLLNDDIGKTKSVIAYLERNNE